VSPLVFAFSIVWQKYWLASIAAVVLIVLAVEFVRSTDRTNEKVSYLFDAIQNEDFTTRFAVDVPLRSEKNLHDSLNRVNLLLRDAYENTRLQERYFEEILNQANIGMLTVNEQGHVLFSNPSALQLFNLDQLNHMKQLQRVDASLFAVLRELEPFDRRLFKFYNERDTIQLPIKSSRIEVKGEKLNLVVVQDIRTELDKKETDSWNRLVRVLTHEIMNTVAPITSISESLLRYYKKGDKITTLADLEQDDLVNTVKGLEVIEEQGKGLVDFVHSYRSFLNVPVPDKKLIQVEPLLERVKALALHHAESKSAVIDVHCEQVDLEVFADEKLVSLVLINIYKNGLEAIADTQGGIIQVRAGVLENDKKFIRIKDNGPGIPADVLEEIFVPFFSTKEKGTGIGLSLSKQIMHVHDGNLNVRSTLGEGSEFELRF